MDKKWGECLNLPGLYCHCWNISLTKIKECGKYGCCRLDPPAKMLPEMGKKETVEDMKKRWLEHRSSHLWYPKTKGIGLDGKNFVPGCRTCFLFNSVVLLYSKEQLIVANLLAFHQFSLWPNFENEDVL